MAVAQAELADTPDRQTRLNARLSVRQKQILEEAAAIEGRTLTDFVLTHAQEAAQRVIHDHFVLSLSERSSRVFFDALLSSWEPDANLRQEISRMREMFGDQ